MTSLDDHVYVVRFGKMKVDVYDALTFTVEKCLQVSFGVSDIAACSRNICLYLSDSNDPSIHRVNLGRTKKWPVANYPHGLLVNANHNVLAACLTEKKLQEYTTDGRLVREICLPAGSPQPWHAVQLSTGDYVVSHYESPGVVNVVAVDGRLLCSYQPSRSSDVGPMKYARRLAVTKHDDVLFADEHNNRILAINFFISGAKVFPVPDDLRLPCAMYLDDTRDRLYLGEMGGKNRLLVLNNASCIPWQL